MMKILWKNIIQKWKTFDKNITVPSFSFLFPLIFFLLGLLGLSVFSLFFGTIFGNLFLSNFGEIQANAILLFLVYLALFIVMMLLLVTNKEILPWFKKQFIQSNSFLEGANIAILMICCATLYSVISNLIFPHASNNNQDSLNQSFEVQPFLSFFCIVLFAPFCEELAYRFGLFGMIAKKSNTLAYVITIFVFAFLHFDFAARGEDLIIEFINIPAYLIGAFFLCYAYQRKGNIVTSITAHTIYNGFEFLLMFISIFVLRQ